MQLGLDTFIPAVLRSNTLPHLLLSFVVRSSRTTPEEIVYIYFHSSWVGVGWQRHCKACRSLRDLDNQGTYRSCSVCFRGRRNGRSSQIIFAGWKKLPTPQKGNDRIMTLTRQLHCNPTAVSKSGHTGKLSIHSTLPSIRMRERPPHKWFFVEWSSPFMRLAEYLSALRGWC